MEGSLPTFSVGLPRGSSLDTMEIGVKKAKDQLSRLVLRVAMGEEITITRKGVPLARLIGVEPKSGPRKLGVYRDKIWIADDFDAPLPPDILAAFLGEDPPKRKRKKR